MSRFYWDFTAPWGHSRADNDAEPMPIEPGPGSDNIVALGVAGTVHATLDDYARFMHLRAAGAKSDLRRHPRLPPGAVQGFRVRDGLGHDGSNTLWRARVLLIPSLGAGFLLVSNVNVEPPVAFGEIQDVLVTRLLAVP